MSDPLRIAVAAEGPTDALVLEAILSALLPDEEFEFQTLQPEGSLAFGANPFTNTGSGWAGVYRWTRQAAAEGGESVTGCSVFSHHDLLIVQLDADVAHKTYQSANISDSPFQDLPCHQPCPPANATTDALQAVLLGWLGEDTCPERVVLCTPSKSIETWILAAIRPDNPVVSRDDWECNLNPAGQLQTLPKAVRFRKSITDYKRRQGAIARKLERGFRTVVGGGAIRGWSPVIANGLAGKSCRRDVKGVAVRTGDSPFRFPASRAAYGLRVGAAWRTAGSRSHGNRLGVASSLRCLRRIAVLTAR